MNIIEAQVSQAHLDGDTFIIPPALVCRRYTDLAMTVLHDCHCLGMDDDTLTELADSFNVPPHRRHPVDVHDYVLHHGRVVIDEWYGPVTHLSHVEPV